MAPTMIRIFGIAILLVTVTHADKSATIAKTVPSNAGPEVPRDFMAYAFEVSTFYNSSFDAAGKPNTFVANLINGISERTGSVMKIRVGGTSGDLGSYAADQKIPANRPATQGGPAFAAPYLTVGPSYFNAFKNFPNAKFVFMVPHYHDKLANSIEWARKGLAVIGDRLDALEIGNEPNFWKDFSVQKYVDRHLKFENGLVQAFPKLNQRILQGIDKAWSPQTFLPAEEAFAKGLNKNNRIKQVGYHYYQYAGANLSPTQLQSIVANHTRTVRQMASYRANIAYLTKSQPSVKFLMSEVGTFMDLSNVNYNNLATALWHVDYFLHCMTIGVDRIHMQQIVHPGFNMWQPVESKWGPAKVQANYYSQPFVADFISKNPPRVVEIPMPGQDVLSAYAGYQSGKLAKIAFVNMNLWSGKGKRPSGNFKLEGLPKGVTGAKVHYLTAKEGSLATNSLTYKGMQWTAGSGGLGHKVGNDTKVVKVVDGKVAIFVEATSAALVDLVWG